jgi:hypothetical protein
MPGQRLQVPAGALIGLLWLLLAPMANAQDVVRLYPDRPPGQGEIVEVQRGLRTLRNVSDPTLEIYLPEPG